MEFFKIVMYTIIGIIVLLFIFIKMYNDIKMCSLKINSVESVIDEVLRSKYESILKIVSIIKQEDEKNKDFDNLEDIKDSNISSFELSRILSDSELKIFEYKNDSKISKNKDFNDLWYKIDSLNIKLQAEEKYYNENTTLYNNFISKFPSKIVALIMKFRERKYFDGKDMNDKNIKDFKI